jgi:riboflavin synthase
MFTGLIEDKGKVVSLTQSGENWKLIVETALPVADIKIGDSIAINGACLTVEEMSGQLLTFHTLYETLDRTSLGSVTAGSPVNMERALRFGDRLDGHIVSGHIDTTVELLSVKQTATDIIVKLQLPKGYELQLIEKGSIAIDGISLTIAKLTDSYFTVHLIPVTWEHTNLSEKRTGDKINIETDVIGKYIQRQLNKTASPSNSSNVTMSTLAEAGFF